jgi:1-acyl-sn-glycerol-3-phosphate acyltransferase
MLDKVLYRSGRRVVDAYTRLMLDMDIVQHAPLPEGPKIIAANHPTTTDPILITILEEDQMSILISETLFKVPVFGRYLRQAGHVPVVAGNGRAAFEAARQLLKEGQTIGIFPEGAISPPDGGFHKAHTGAARLALSTGATVIPVGIHLQRERIRLIETEVDGKIEVGTWYLRGPYTMVVGEPMHFAGDVEDREHVRSVSDQIMRRIIYLAEQGRQRMKEAQAATNRQRDKVFAGARWIKGLREWAGGMI